MVFVQYIMQTRQQHGQPLAKPLAKNCVVEQIYLSFLSIRLKLTSGR
jgi:hypothetical protein